MHGTSKNRICFERNVDDKEEMQVEQKEALKYVIVILS
jgi:hypothetical protein